MGRGWGFFNIERVAAREMREGRVGEINGAGADTG